MIQKYNIVIRIWERSFFAIIFVVIIMIPLVSADANVTHNTTPFISIDPIGNHAIGDVFVIKGTTNLPPVVNTLHIVITSSSFNPGGFGSDFQSTVPIQRGEKDINYWSCNVPTKTGWATFQGPGRNPAEDASPDNYFVTVELSTDANVSQFQLFDILPAGPDTNSTISPTPIPFITIYPIGNHTINDVFIIHGITNLAYGNDTIAINIRSSDFNPGGFGTSFYLVNASIQPGENGMNTWSAEIIPANWEIYTEPPPYRPAPQFENVRPNKYTVYLSPNGPIGSTVLVSQDFFIVSTAVKTQPSFIVITGAGTISPGNTPAPTQQSAPHSTIVTIIALLAGSFCLVYLRKREGT
jgi:hypothetical protein